MAEEAEAEQEEEEEGPGEGLECWEMRRSLGMKCRGVWRAEVRGDRLLPKEGVAPVVGVALEETPPSSLVLSATGRPGVGKEHGNDHHI